MEAAGRHVGKREGEERNPEVAGDFYVMNPENLAVAGDDVSCC